MVEFPSAPAASPLALALRSAQNEARNTSAKAQSPGMIERAVRARMAGLANGQLHVRVGTERATYGSAASDGLEATITVLNPGFWRALLFGGSTGAANAYSEGMWYCDDLCACVRLFARNKEAAAGLDGGLALLAQPLMRLGGLLKRNTRRGARANIAAHYDLSNEFFRLWLDPTMTYSAGIFEEPGSTLEQAQFAKLDRLCRKLDLQSSDHLLEIGTGWGSMSMHAAKHFGCRVTTTTISAEQFALATERVQAAGLADRIEVLQSDYRDLTGVYDKLVSVEMIEAVGHDQFPTFFAAAERLLKPDGLAAIQAITIADTEYERARKEVDFIRRYIFPGSTIPSVTRLCEAALAGGDLRLTHLEDITPHYERTMTEWRLRFYATLEEARAQGFDDSFLRMWEFYLCYCEGAFAERHIGDVQLVFSRPGDRRPSLLPARSALERPAGL